MKHRMSIIESTFTPVIRSKQQQFVHEGSSILDFIQFSNNVISFKFKTPGIKLKYQ